MKKEINTLVRKFGGSTHYQGSTRTMFINEPENWDNMKSLAEYIKENYQQRVEFAIKSNENE